MKQTTNQLILDELNSEKKPLEYLELILRICHKNYSHNELSNDLQKLLRQNKIITTKSWKYRNSTKPDILVSYCLPSLNTRFNLTNFKFLLNNWLK